MLESITWCIDAFLMLIDDAFFDIDHWNGKFQHMKLRKILKCIADVLVVAARDYLFKLYWNNFLSDRLQVTQFGGPEIGMCKKN